MNRDQNGIKPPEGASPPGMMALQLTISTKGARPLADFEKRKIQKRAETAAAGFAAIHAAKGLRPVAAHAMELDVGWVMIVMGVNLDSSDAVVDRFIFPEGQVVQVT